MLSISTVFERQTREGENLINGEKIAIKEINRFYSVDMQFVGQTHLLRVDLDFPTPSTHELRAAFEDAYFKRFKVDLQEIQVNFGCRATLRSRFVNFDRSKREKVIAV